MPESAEQQLWALFWIFDCLTYLPPYAAECSTNASTNWTGICHPTAIDDSTPQPLSDSKPCESECSNDPNHQRSECAEGPNYSRCNTDEIWQDFFQLWKARSLCPVVSRSTSTVHPNSRNDCTTKPQWKSYPNPSSTELRSREG
jgi:hypothetical protein